MNKQEDLISRQDAIDALCSKCQGRCIPCDSYPCSEVGAIKAVPSAQPEIVLELLKTQPTIEPRKGKWKEHKDYPGLAYLCSECGYFTTMRMNFCPNCGADMRGGQDALN